MPLSFANNDPLVFAPGVVAIRSGFAMIAGNTVKLIVAVEQGGDRMLHKVYVACVVPVNPAAGV